MGTGDALGDFWCIYLFGVAQQRIIRGLRLRLFGAIVRQDIGFFDTTPSGEIASRLTADCAEMANDLTWVFRFTIEAVVRLGSILLYMFVRSWRLGLLAIAIVPATALINRSYARFMHRNQQQVQAALADANAIAIEVIGAIRTVCSFAGERREQARYQAKVEKFYSLIVRQTAVQGVYYMVCNTFLINTCVQAALLAYGCFLVERGLLSHTVLLAFMLYQGQLQEYAQNLLNSFTSLLKSSGAAAKVFDYIERRPRYRRPDKGGGGRGGESTENGDACGLVELRDVFFCYPSRPEAAVLRGLSLTVLPGQTVALVGQSGSGKSTVLHLLKHFYEATSGCVRIDGRDVCDMPHAELHAVAASVSQEPVLLSGTIEDNIRYALSARAASNDDEAALRERLVAAATAANAHGFISGLRDGYQTAVGERGVQLSGGQRQRIAIARSLLLDPAVLLLDEATSALDAESEAAVQEALERAMQGRTTLVIAHRLSTVRHADCIVLMHGGAAVEAGTHDELIARPLPAGGAPSYRQLVKLQTAAGGGDT
ncbi:putative ABC transporter [Emiliania huxleyi CCMP1516]|uniref:ABC transporter n=2 Tax=Emiliania huxleyi TaxID=2903 RepID=A0A0D3KI27_EMIH1|nr:putative ABC transporter [Emiliania huxleyi CCMP1516]EOD35412.1 putative ABC transporter [Emiliania huxleyi CCMP1516]|eukprot:XP_005787841.1 putative ABC transporter [Emiliania huxleyi CCMP1516]